MRINGLTIKNKSICVKDIYTDFTEPGLYLLKGSIGSGKSVFINTILFGDGEAVTFDNPKENELYKEDRNSLFSYMSQYRFSVGISSYEYIKRRNKTIDEDKLKQYLEIFDISDRMLKRPYSELSGGEAVKVAFISTLLKNTRYIILDEPTNQVDDATFDAMMKILGELANDHVIIMICHDERVGNDCRHIYTFENDHVTCDVLNDHKYTNEITKPSKTGFNSIRIALGCTNKPILMASFFVLMAMTLYIYMFNESRIMNTYPEDTNYPKDWIELHPSFTNDESIGFEEAERIAKTSGISDVYMFDEAEWYYHELEKVNYIVDEIKDKKPDIENYIISAPEIVRRNPKSDFFGRYNLGRLHTYPHDNEDEVVISYSLLERVSDTEYDSYESVIGSKITLPYKGGTKEYTVIDVYEADSYLSDFILVSYDDTYSYYHYSPETYDGFVKKQKEFSKDTGRISECVIETILLHLETGKEETVVKKLNSEYKERFELVNYYEYKIRVDKYRGDLLCKMLIYNILIAIIVVLIYCLFNVYSTNYDYNLIYEYQNYYIDRKKIRFWYMMLHVFVIACVYLIGMLGMGLIAKKNIGGFLYYRDIYMFYTLIMFFLTIAVIVLNRTFASAKVRKAQR